MMYLARPKIKRSKRMKPNRREGSEEVEGTENRGRKVERRRWDQGGKRRNVFVALLEIRA